MISLEKKVQISMLLQIYGKMLTEKQYELANDYYNNDLSLSEIAEGCLINTSTGNPLVFA